MRYLGANPARPADEVEALVMIAVNNRLVADQRRAAKAAERKG